VQRFTRLGFGVVGLGGSLARSAITRIGASEAPALGAAASSSPSALKLLPGALIGVGLAAERRVFEASAAIESRVILTRRALSQRSPRAVPAGTRRVEPAGTGRVERYLEQWRTRGEEEQARNRFLVGELVSRLAPELADAVVARIDLNKIIAAIPIEDLLGDLDLDALIKRIDLGSLLGQVDLAPLVVEILGAVDLPGIIRESTSSIGGETVHVVRSQAIGADAVVERVTDRLLFRKRARSDGAAASDDDSSAEPEIGAESAAGAEPEAAAAAETESASP
jgi:hypothetical protein